MTSGYIQWNRINNLVKSWIYGSVVAHIVGNNSALEMWKILKNVFLASSNARVLDLHLQLQTVKKDAMSFEDYVQRIKTIAYHLAAIGEPVSKRYLILCVRWLECRL